MSSSRCWLVDGSSHTSPSRLRARGCLIGGRVHMEQFVRRQDDVCHVLLNRSKVAVLTTKNK